MNIYVWKGDSVLKDYSSGMVVVAAESREDAWAKLQSSPEGFRAYYALKHGWPYCMDDLDVQYYSLEGRRQSEPGFPIEPIEYEIGKLPILVQWGGA